MGRTVRQWALWLRAMSPAASLTAALAATLTAALTAGLIASTTAVAQPPQAVPGAPGEFSPQEIQRILAHGPWPQPVLRDASNRVSGNPQAIALGQMLFFDARLSRRTDMACATCHQPGRGFTDGRDRAEGSGAAKPRLDRNTQGLWNVAHGRWFGWDGGSDSLWNFALRPMLHPDELAASAAHIARLVRQQPDMACRYGTVFGKQVGASPAADELVMVNVAKALAAYLETLQSGKSNFDLLHDALARGDLGAASNYPAAARRGLAIFTGKGNCSTCHFGPNFSNGEFHDIGIPYTLGPGRVDSGRHGGIRRVKEDKYNLLGRYSNDASRASGSRTRHVAENHATFGQFKVPSLRNVALTAPYMHNGRLATLHDAVRHYSELNEERLHQDGEALLKPLRLPAGQIADLVAFLETLTSRTFVDPSPALTPCLPAAK